MALPKALLLVALSVLIANEARGFPPYRGYVWEGTFAGDGQPVVELRAHTGVWEYTSVLVGRVLCRGTACPARRAKIFLDGTAGRQQLDGVLSFGEGRVSCQLNGVNDPFARTIYVQAECFDLGRTHLRSRFAAALQLTVRRGLQGTRRR